VEGIIVREDDLEELKREIISVLFSDFCLK